MHTPARLTRVLLWTTAALTGSVLLAALLVSSLGWNWLRSPLERLAATHTGRVLAIQGDLSVSLGWPTVQLHAAQVTFANPAWATAPHMVAADGVAISVDVPALLRRKLVFPEVTLNTATIFVEQSADGRKSWLLDLAQQDENARITIGHVALQHGTLGYDDASQHISLRAQLSTEPPVTAGSSSSASKRGGSGKAAPTPASVFSNPGMSLKGSAVVSCCLVS